MILSAALIVGAFIIVGASLVGSYLDGARRCEHTPPYRCPVCEGRQWVPAGFYSGLPSISSEPCRACTATGIVWEQPT